MLSFPSLLTMSDTPLADGQANLLFYFNSPNKRSFMGLGGVVRGLDSLTGPKSVRVNWPLWSPVVSPLWPPVAFLWRRGGRYIYIYIYIVPKFRIRHWDHNSNLRVFRPLNDVYGHPVKSQRIAISTHPKLSFGLGVSP